MYVSQAREREDCGEGARVDTAVAEGWSKSLPPREI